MSSTANPIVILPQYRGGLEASVRISPGFAYRLAMSQSRNYCRPAATFSNHCLSPAWCIGSGNGAFWAELDIEFRRRQPQDGQDDRKEDAAKGRGAAYFGVWSPISNKGN